MKHIYLVLALFVLGLTMSLFSCSETNSGPLELPLEVHYSINSIDTGVQAMVHAYFGEDMRYILHDSVRVTMERKALLAEVIQWYDVKNLWITERNGDYCTCVHLNGELLDFWKKDEYLQEAKFGASSNNRILGVPVYSGTAKSENGDTTWIECAPEYPNAWYEHSGFPGLPLRYTYKLRGEEVVYEADSISSSVIPFTPEAYNKSCVSIPAEAYMGFSPMDTISWTSDKVWVFGDLLNMDNEYLQGDLLIQTFEYGVESRSKLRITEGVFDVELAPGKRYVMDFWSPGYAHNRISLDCTKMPYDGTNLILDLSNHLIQPANEAVREYTENTLMGVAEYIPDSASLVFDFQYTEEVGKEIKRLAKER